MQFPLIPPLPPSNAYDKENQRQSEAQNRSNNVGSHKKPSAPSSQRGVAFSSSSLSLTPQSRNSSLGIKPLSAQRESYLSSSPSQPVMRRHSQGSKRRVLRYGETVESLFCLAENTALPHRTLCRDIAEGPLSDDPSAWLRAVQAATKEVANKADNNKEQGENIIFVLPMTCIVYILIYSRACSLETCACPSSTTSIHFIRYSRSRFDSIASSGHVSIFGTLRKRLVQGRRCYF